MSLSTKIDTLKFEFSNMIQAATSGLKLCQEIEGDMAKLDEVSNLLGSLNGKKNKTNKNVTPGKKRGRRSRAEIEAEKAATNPGKGEGA